MAPSENGRNYKSSDGLDLHYRDFGIDISGTPVVCLPGLTRNSRDFIDVANYIGDRRRVIAPDFRGRGDSARDPNWKNYHPGTYVADIWRLLNELAIDKVILIGTSLGGLCSMAMAAMDASRLACVIMNDVGPEINPAGLARIQEYTGRLKPPATWEEAIDQTREVYGEFLPGLTDNDWEKMVWKAYRKDENGAPIVDCDENVGRAVREVGAQVGDPWMFFDALVPVPTKLLWGVNSDVLSKDIVDKMQARKPDLEIIEVANRGHAPLLDEPECLAAIDAVLLEIA